MDDDFGLTGVPLFIAKAICWLIILGLLGVTIYYGIQTIIIAHSLGDI